MTLYDEVERYGLNTGPGSATLLSPTAETMPIVRKSRKRSSSAVASWALSIVQLSFLYTNRLILRMSRHAMKSAFGGFFTIFSYLWTLVVFFKNLFTGFIPNEESRGRLTDGCKAIVRQGINVIFSVPRLINRVAINTQYRLVRAKNSLARPVQHVTFYVHAGFDELRAIKEATIHGVSHVKSAASYNLRRASLAAQSRYYRLKYGVINMGEHLLGVETRLRHVLSEKLSFHSKKPAVLVSNCRGLACQSKQSDQLSKTGWFGPVSDFYYSLVNSARTAYSSMVSRLSGLSHGRKPAQVDSVVVRGANLIAVKLKNTKDVLLIRLANVGHEIRSAVQSKAHGGVTFITIKMKGTKDWISIRLTDFGHSIHSSADYFQDRISTRIHDGLLRGHRATSLIKHSISTAWRNSLGRVSMVGLMVKGAWNQTSSRIVQSVSPILMAPVKVVRRVTQIPSGIHVGLLCVLLVLAYLALLIVTRFKRTVYALSLAPHNKLFFGLIQFIFYTLSSYTYKVQIPKKSLWIN